MICFVSLTTLKNRERERERKRFALVHKPIHKPDKHPAETKETNKANKDWHFPPHSFEPLAIPFFVNWLYLYAYAYTGWSIDMAIILEGQTDPTKCSAQHPCLARLHMKTIYHIHKSHTVRHSPFSGWNAASNSPSLAARTNASKTSYTVSCYIYIYLSLIHI